MKAGAKPALLSLNTPRDYTSRTKDHQTVLTGGADMYRDDRTRWVIRLSLLIAALPWQPGFAADKGVTPGDWAHVQVVTYASGLTGFFDTRSGTLYLYDSNLDKAVFIRRISELGAPLEKIKK
jgi:hypothetical protein